MSSGNPCQGRFKRPTDRKRQKLLTSEFGIPDQGLLGPKPRCLGGEEDRAFGRAGCPSREMEKRGRLVRWCPGFLPVLTRPAQLQQQWRVRALPAPRTIPASPENGGAGSVSWPANGRGAPSILASMQVRVLAVGRRTAKEQWAEEPVNEYVQRLSPFVAVNCEWLKDDDALMRRLLAAKEGWKVALDERGELLTSAEFSKRLYRRLETAGGRVLFVIGGADGLTDDIRSLVNELISLSALTFTHKMARLILVEQIYRAVELHRGTRYHK